MNHQRILVMAIAVAQTVSSRKTFFVELKLNKFSLSIYERQALAHFALFLICLGLIHAKEIAHLLLLDRIDQKEREEYYETPRIHGISTNDIRFMEGDKLITFILVIMYVGTAVAGIYALCTLGLLIGTLKRRCELIVPWMVFHSFVCVLSGLGLFVAYLHRNEYVNEYVGDGYTVCE